MVELSKRTEENKQQNSPDTVTRFGRVLTGFAIADAAMVLFLSSGFVFPTQTAQTEPGGMPADFYNYSDKISPFTPPVPEPVVLLT